MFRLRVPLLKKLYVNTFPAVHLKKMDMWDYAWHFSSEVLVGVFVLIIAASQVILFSGDPIVDKSLASTWLGYHVDQNPQLYARNTATKTLVVQKTFFPEAFADNTQPVSPALTDTSLVENDNTLALDQIPDSVRELLQKQIQVYTTTDTDTLGSLARKFNISIDTIKWANNLPNNTIKPGWQLLMLPVNGILYKVGNTNVTLPDIAKRFHADIGKIVAYNALENEQDIDVGQILIIPDGIIPLPVAPPKPQPKPTTKPSRTIGVYDSVADETGKAGHIFPKGYCTYYVAKKMHISFGGNAKNWLANARAAGGYTVSNEPMVHGAVVTTDDKRYGHVAFVEEVTDTAIRVSEMNFKGFGVVSSRWIPINSKTIRGYIHE